MAEISPKRRLRCAIYTRKSSEEGLEQDFNSLDAQREACAAYIASQKHEGWVCLPERYDDGGYSGGNIERPALQRLVADIEQGKIDCVVVYKVDRLSRSLLDFSGIMGSLDRQRVSQLAQPQHTLRLQRQPRRTAVDHAADRRPMALAPGGDTKQVAEGVVRHQLRR